MKIALVHDYLKEFGGAERVLEALSEIFPDAPIYTAFFNKKSDAYKRFSQKKVISSWAQKIPGFATKLHSPLRFLAPFIWGSFKEELKQYDVVISSASWYVTKGFGDAPHPDLLPKGEGKGKKNPIEICYCHTPPRWLYGYKTAVEWQRFWPIKIYGTIIGHFMRQYDFVSAQKVDYFIANSQETASRIKKFYRRESTVIYPPVHVASSLLASSVQLDKKKLNANFLDAKRSSYYFVVSRIVGSKGLSLAIDAANKLGIKLKIAGASGGYGSTYENLSSKAKENIEFLGFVSDEELAKLYSEAKAFLALAEDEDFGITPVEAMSFGTPVIAYYGGGYKETVVDAHSASSGQGPTGVFFHDPTPESLIQAIKKFEKLSIKPEDCITQAQKFSKERFMKEIKQFIEKRYREK